MCDKLNAEFRMQSAKLWSFLRKQIEIIGEADPFILHFAYCILHSCSICCTVNANFSFNILSILL